MPKRYDRSSREGLGLKKGEPSGTCSDAGEMWPPIETAVVDDEPMLACETCVDGVSDDRRAAAVATLNEWPKGRSPPCEGEPARMVTAEDEDDGRRPREWLPPPEPAGEPEPVEA